MENCYILVVWEHGNQKTDTSTWKLTKTANASALLSDSLNTAPVIPLSEINTLLNDILTPNIFLYAKEEFLTGFDKEYLNISKFNNAETDSMSENELRVFLEEYLKTIFAKQYDEYKLTSKQLGERIDELERIGVITSDVKTKLHYYRNELNSGSHTFQMNTIDDDRNFSIDFVHYLFDNVHMG